MAVSPKGKRKIIVNDEEFYWRVDNKNGLDDLEVIEPRTHRAVRYSPLSRIQGESWSEDIFELVQLGGEIFAHVEGEGRAAVIIERVCVRPGLVREVILKRFFGQERRHSDRIKEAIDRATASRLLMPAAG